MIPSNIVPILFLVSLVLNGCSNAGRTVLILNENDNGRTITLNVSDRLDVALYEQGSTGYVWKVSPINESVLKRSSESSFQPDSEAAGAGGVRTFHFEAVAAGSTNMQVIKHKPWETGVPPIQTFEAEITVK